MGILGDTAPKKKERVDEYEYTVQPAAIETFTNLMREQGVIMAWDGKRFVFTSSKLLNMKRLKERGVIRSYTIATLTRSRKVVEES